MDSARSQPCWPGYTPSYAYACASQRDPRWGRSQEVTGECPLLNAEFAAHFIGGAQNGAPDTPRDDRYLLSALTAKHFSMYLQHPRTCTAQFLSRLVGRYRIFNWYSRTEFWHLLV